MGNYVNLVSFLLCNTKKKHFCARCNLDKDAYVISLPSYHPSNLFHCVFWCWQTLQQTLDSGKPLPFPDGVLINGQTSSSFSGDQGYSQNFEFFSLIPQKIRSFHVMSFLNNFDTRVDCVLLTIFSWFSF